MGESSPEQFQNIVLQVNEHTVQAENARSNGEIRRSLV